MAQRVFINLPVSNVERSTKFYEALGFTKNEMFSDAKASCMVWSDSIFVMILDRSFFATFLHERPVGDTKSTNSVLIALEMDSKEAVQNFADAAAANGGSFYKVATQMPDDMMFGYEVLDPDGNQFEPLWMNPDFNPQQA